nr:MAG TPA_asm: hypothetical protein [Caudoviricetes sp.]
MYIYVYDSHLLPGKRVERHWQSFCLHILLNLLHLLYLLKCIFQWFFLGVITVIFYLRKLD